MLFNRVFMSPVILSSELAANLDAALGALFKQRCLCYLYDSQQHHLEYGEQMK